MTTFRLVSVVFGMAISAQAMALTAAEVLGPCQAEYEIELADVKKEFLRSTPWNYDRDYGIDQVAASAAYDVREDGFKVDVFLNVEGLIDMPFTYFFKPYFSLEVPTQCDFVRAELIGTN